MSNMSDYEEVKASFKLEVPDQFNFTSDVMFRRAEETPDKVALIGIEPDGITVNRYSYGDLADMANRTAHLLRSYGIGKGDRVFVQLPRIVEWYAVLLGCFQIGAVPMPGTTQLMPKDQQYRINRAEASAAVCDVEGAQRLDAVKTECPSLGSLFVVGGEVDGWVSFGPALEVQSAEPAAVEPTTPNDPLLLYFTSGTTGGPKMVQHLGSYALAHEVTARFWHDLGPDDVHWTVSDTGWAKAAWGKLLDNGSWAPQWSCGTSSVNLTSIGCFG